MLLLENRQHQEALLIARETPGILDAFAACTPQQGGPSSGASSVGPDTLNVADAASLEATIQALA